MKEFTLQQLRELSPCPEGLEWYEANVKTEDPREILIQLNNHKPRWSRWLMVRMISPESRKRLAIFSARSVLHIYEGRYPENKRVRECIEAAEDYLDGKIDRDELLEKRRAAYAAYAAAAYAVAADAAYADAADAAAAAYAAYAAYADAAAAAADAAAYAAYAADADAAAYAAYAADAAAAAAAAYAIDAKKETQEKIIDESVRLYEGE